MEISEATDFFIIQRVNTSNKVYKTLIFCELKGYIFVESPNKFSKYSIACKEYYACNNFNPYRLSNDTIWNVIDIMIDFETKFYR